MANDTSTNCFEFSDSDEIIIGLSEVIVNTLSLVVCTCVILVIVIYKKYFSSVQKLVLWYTIALLLDVISHIVEGAGYWLFSHGKNKVFCQVLAFFIQYSILSTQVSLMCIVLEVYLCVLLRKNTERMKWVYLAIIYLIPASVSWIPFAFKRFGRNKSWCSIKYLDEGTCDKNIAGMVLIALLSWLPLILTIIVTGPLYYIILSQVLHQAAQTVYTPLVEVNRRQVYRQTLKDLKHFKLIPVLIFILNIFPIGMMAVSYFKPVSESYLWSAVTVARAIQGMATPLLLVLDPETRRRLHWNNFRAAWRQKFLQKYAIEDYPTPTGELCESVIIQNTE